MSLLEALRLETGDERIAGFMAIGRDLRELLDRRLAPCGVTYAQYALLQFIGHPRGADGKPIDPPIRATEIARYYGYAQRTVTVALNSLETRGYILRERSPTDRRSYMLGLTTKGQKTLARAEVAYKKIRSNIFSGIPINQWAMFAYAIPSMLRYIATETRKDKLKKRRK